MEYCDDQCSQGGQAHLTKIFFDARYTQVTAEVTELQARQQPITLTVAAVFLSQVVQ